MNEAEPEVCKLCGSAAKLVRAHLVPNAFYRRAMVANGFSLLVGPGIAGQGKRAETGLFDGRLVCDSCEKSFDKRDAFAARFFLRKRYQSSRWSDGDLRLEIVTGINSCALRDSLLSILWRVAASGRQECESVRGRFSREQLGRLQELLSSPARDWKDEFQMLVTRFDWPAAVIDPHGFAEFVDPRDVVLFPGVVKFGEKECVQICLSDFAIYINISSPWVDDGSRMWLIPGNQIDILLRDYGESHELLNLKRTVRRLVSRA